MKKLVLTVLLSMLIAPAFAGVVQTESQTKSFSGLPTLNADLVFAKFDQHLGSLDSIEVIVNLTSSGGDLIMDNDSDEEADGTFNFGADASFTVSEPFVNSSFQPVVASLAATHSGVVDLDANTGDGALDFDPTPGDGMQYLGQAMNDSDSGFLASAIFGDWTGFGESVTISVSASQVSNVTATGGVEIAYTPINISGDATVIYTYTTPEPATMGLLALGGLFIRRRK